MRLSAGNENERHHLLPLLDELQLRGRSPAELWADRGYHSKALVALLRERGIKPEISVPRRGGDPIPEGTKIRIVARGKGTQIKVADTKARYRWPIERTNAWLRNCPRIDVRRDVKSDNYFAFLQVRSIILLAKKTF